MSDTIIESMRQQHDELLKLRDEALRLCARHAHHPLKGELDAHLRIIDSAIDQLEAAMRKARKSTERRSRAVRASLKSALTRESPDAIWIHASATNAARVSTRFS